MAERVINVEALMGDAASDREVKRTAQKGDRVSDGGRTERGHDRETRTEA